MRLLCTVFPIQVLNSCWTQIPHVMLGGQNLILKFLDTYRKVASSNTSCLEAHAGFFRWLMKRIFDPYVLWPFDNISITLVRTCNYSVYDLLIYGLLVAFLVFVALKVQPKASPEYFTPFDDIEVKRYKSYCFFTYLDFALTFMTLISLFQFTWDI